MSTLFKGSAVYQAYDNWFQLTNPGFKIAANIGVMADSWLREFGISSERFAQFCASPGFSSFSPFLVFSPTPPGDINNQEIIQTAGRTGLHFIMPSFVDGLLPGWRFDPVTQWQNQLNDGQRFDLLGKYQPLSLLS